MYQRKLQSSSAIFTIVKLRNLQCSNVFEEIFLVQGSEFFCKIEEIEAINPIMKGILVLFLRAFFLKTLSYAETSNNRFLQLGTWDLSQ